MYFYKMLSYCSIQSSDFNKVYNLAKQIWQENYQEMISQSQIDYMLDMMYNPTRLKNDLLENYQWEFIYYENKLVGYLAYVKKEDQRVFLSKIYLKTSVQGKGLGQDALKRVIAFANSNNCKSVYLTVNKGNNKGIKAYDKFGFKIIAEKVLDIGNGYVMDDYIFEYTL